MIPLAPEGVRIIRSPGNFVCPVVDSEYQVACRLANQAGRIGKRGQVFTKCLRPAAVALEFESLSFDRHSPEVVD